MTLKDTPPPGVMFVSIQSTGGPVPDSCAPPSQSNAFNPSCTWNTLANGAMPRLAITYHINPSTTGQRTNGDVILTNTFDPTQSNNFAGATTNIGCTNNLTGTQSSLSLASGSWCINGATVNGPVTIGTGAQVVIVSSRFNSSITSSRAASFALCGSTVTGGVSVSGTTGFVLIGDPGDDVCAANTLGSSVTLSNNTGGVEIAGNTRIGGNVSLTGNSGAGPFPEDFEPEVEGNTIVGSLYCASNSPGVKNDGSTNNAGGAKTGQCAGL